MLLGMNSPVDSTPLLCPKRGRRVVSMQENPLVLSSSASLEALVASSWSNDGRTGSGPLADRGDAADSSIERDVQRCGRNCMTDAIDIDTIGESYLHTLYSLLFSVLLTSSRCSATRCKGAGVIGLSSMLDDGDRGYCSSESKLRRRGLICGRKCKVCVLNLWLLEAQALSSSSSSSMIGSVYDDEDGSDGMLATIEVMARGDIEWSGMMVSSSRLSPS
mmetsp:Transcript_3838/g.10177  ORF Transcript_3838/g.10177 Transcript_3838/m.10177 type:complete len:219 (+) Transcript_3838:286-942(+)